MLLILLIQNKTNKNKRKNPQIKSDTKVYLKIYCKDNIFSTDFIMMKKEVCFVII